MTRLYILVEGESEERFVSEIIAPHLWPYEIYATASNMGGVKGYEQTRTQISNWLKQDANAYVTTMLDYFRLPSSFPQVRETMTETDPYKKVDRIQKAIDEEIGSERFLSYIQLHEFEALLLSEPLQFVQSFFEHVREIARLKEICDQFDSPELINGGVNTAPSKRIIELIPAYEPLKPVASLEIARSIGLTTMREKCPHFSKWIESLEGLRDVRK